MAMAGSKGKGSRANYQKRQKYALTDLLDRAKDLPEDYNDLVSAYRTLAKAADQRLVRLEKAAQEPNYGNATQWAYARAQRDIKEWSGEAATRFNTKPPASKAQLTRKIEDIRTFLNGPTSTKKGIMDVYKQRADTINKKYGTKFTWQSLAKFYDSGQAELWDSKFGSKTALRTIGVIQKKSEEMLKRIREAEEKDQKADNNDMIEAMVKKALADNELNIEDLL